MANVASARREQEEKFPQPNVPDVLHPFILWAQRQKQLFLTIDVDDIVVTCLQVRDNRQLIFKGIGGRDRQTYECDLDLFGWVNGDGLKQNLTGIRLELTLEKVHSENAPDWWPRLVKTEKRVPWIKVDFARWKEEETGVDGYLSDAKSDYTDEPAWELSRREARSDVEKPLLLPDKIDPALHETDDELPPIEFEDEHDD